MDSGTSITSNTSITHMHTHTHSSHTDRYKHTQTRVSPHVDSKKVGIQTDVHRHTDKGKGHGPQEHLYMKFT